jgi:hypothetical protein
MKIRINILIGGIVILVALIYSVLDTSSQAQTNPNNTNQTDDVSLLSLSLSSPKSSYVLFEPVSLTFLLKNNTNRVVNDQTVLGFGPNLKVLVTNENNELTEIEGSTLSGRGYLIASNVPLQPNQERSKQEIVDDNSIEKLFPNPGRYTVRVSLFNQANQTVTSNSVTIEITQPQGVDQQALDYIKTVLKPAEKRNKFNDLTLVQQQFVNNFRTSVYWKYVIVKLASNYQLLGKFTEAEREFCKVSTVSFPYSEKVRKNLEKLNTKLRRVALIPNLPENAEIPIISRPCTPINR